MINDLDCNLPVYKYVDDFTVYEIIPRSSTTSSYQLAIQYSPKIMHAQEVAQEVLAPQEHASGQKKLNCGLSARSKKRKKLAGSTARVVGVAFLW